MGEGAKIEAIAGSGAIVGSGAGLEFDPVLLQQQRHTYEDNTIKNMIHDTTFLSTSISARVILLLMSLV